MLLLASLGASYIVVSSREITQTVIFLIVDTGTLGFLMFTIAL